MKTFSSSTVCPLLVGLLGIFFAPCARVEPAAEPFDPSWATAPLWDDGQAEVSLYEAHRLQYGKSETYEALFIVVKEDFDPALHVKADPPYAGKSLLPVLKLNMIHSYWTANYPYHYLASVFVHRRDPTRLVKETMGSQEWCGNTFKEVKTWTDPPQLHFHSYFDGEADGRRVLSLRPGDLLEDQLPLVLRGLRFHSGLRVERRIVPSLVSNNVRDAVRPVDAVIKVMKQETIRTPAGRFAAWKVGVTMEGVEQTWWFEQEAPHTMLKMESSDGRSWVLKSRSRRPYWRTPTYQPKM